MHARQSDNQLKFTVQMIYCDLLARVTLHMEDRQHNEIVILDLQLHLIVVACGGHIHLMHTPIAQSHLKELFLLGPEHMIQSRFLPIVAHRIIDGNREVEMIDNEDSRLHTNGPRDAWQVVLNCAMQGERSLCDHQQTEVVDRFIHCFVEVDFIGCVGLLGV